MSTLTQTRRADTKPASPKRKPQPVRKPAVARRPAYLQTKLAVSEPGDAQEQEADRIAKQVARSPRRAARAGLAPGGAGPESEQDLAPARLARQAGPEGETAQTRLARSLARETEPEEDTAQAKLARAPARQAEPGEETAQTRLALARQAEPEEDAAQTKLARALDRQAETEAEEETAQTQLARALARQAEAEEVTAQMQPDQPEVAGTEVSPQTEQRIDNLRGMGAPLPDDVRADMESRFGRDLSDVRIHTSAEAAALCAEVNARAFTVGNDVFFAPGEFAPETEQGRELLAHELTHVRQQGGGAARKLMRANGAATGSGTGDGDASSGPPYSVSSGEYAGTTIDPSKKELDVARISLPDFKGRRHRGKFNTPLELSTRGSTQQVSKWREAVHSDAQRHLNRLAQQARNRGGENESGMVFFQARQRSDFLLFGTEQELLPRFEIPIWDRAKHGRSHQVDHIVEAQIGGPDDVNNYELLDAVANMSAGSKLAHQIRQRLQGALRALREENPGNTNIPRPSKWKYVKNNYDVEFSNFDFQLSGFSGAPNRYWLLDEIKDGRHADRLRPLRERELERLGREGRLIFFASESGGEQMPIPRRKPTRNWVPRVDYLDWQPVEGDVNPGGRAGTLLVDVFKSRTGQRRAKGIEVDPDYAQQSWGVTKIDGIYGGVIRSDDVASGIKQSLRLPGMSPIHLDGVRLDSGGIHGQGRLLPTVPLIGDADIRIAVDGDSVQLRKTFETGEIAIPAPFEINDSSLTVFYDSRRGLGLEGRADFAIERIGEGHVAGDLSADGSFGLDGEFSFDSSLFDPAKVEVSYRDDAFSISGEIGIPEGKVRGIQSATVTVAYSEGEGFRANGEAELDIPGVERGTLSIARTEEQGFAIGGSFDLSSDTPGIRSGHIEAQLAERPDGEGYNLTASGEALPDIPGFDSTLSVCYADGAITAEASARYQRGLLDGSIRAGATNRTLDEDGNPTGEPGEEIIVYGGGDVTIQIAPWLEGTAGIAFAPDGEVTVTGEIGLPDQIELFPRKEIDKSIFNISVQAPIVPGIVAEVGGGLSAQAGIGPGVIDQLRLGITYNPAHEEDTQVTGDAHLEVPADAGLRLSVRAGIGLGITGASATGGLEVGGTLGIEGAAEAGVHIDWMPSQGLEINADVAVHAQPSFTFDISGYVAVTALGFSVYDQRWELASFSYGSDYRFGIRLPVNYTEGEPFDIALSDVEFEVPDIDTDRLLKGLIDRIG